jgi:hypothetical protein
MQKRGVPIELVLVIVVLALALVFWHDPNITGGSILSIDVSSCGTITENSTLTADVSAIGTCFTIATSGVTLDCNGHTITYGGDGAGPAVLVNGADDVVVQNCVIRSVAYSASSAADGIGVKLSDAESALIQNNSINTDGINNNVGVLLTNSNYSRIIDNRITGDSSSGNSNADDNDAIRAHYSSNIVIEDNTLWTNGSDYNSGIELKFSDHVNITGNTIYARGSTYNWGIHLDKAWYINVFNNVIRTLGFNGYGIGIGIYNGFNGFIDDNTIYTGQGSTLGANNYGIWASSGTGDYDITDNVINTYGTNNGFGVHASNVADLYIARNTINASGTQGDNYGIRIGTRAQVEYNSVQTDSTGGSGSNLGLYVEGSNANIVGNNVSVTGGSSNEGMRIDSSRNYNLIANNTIYSTGRSGSASHAISLYGSYNTVRGNNLTSARTNSHAIYSSNGMDNLIHQNLLNTLSSSSNGIQFLSGPSSWNISENNFSVRNYGIRFFASGNDHDVWSNRIQSNSYAISIESSQSTHMFWNNIFNRSGGSIPINDPYGGSAWNISSTTSYQGVSAPNIIGGANLGGNWYGDQTYNDTDGDGFADDGSTVQTYTISGGGGDIDYLPLAFEGDPVTLIGTLSDINSSGFTALDIKINDTSINVSTENIIGLLPVNITDNGTTFVKFDHNFSITPLNLSKTIFAKTSKTLLVNLGGLLEDGETKTLYFEDNGFNFLCVKDAEIASISAVSPSCTGTNETSFTSCLTSAVPITHGSITCTKNGTTLEVAGLRNSAITADTTTSSSSSGGGGSSTSDRNRNQDNCLENWVCGDWGECIDGTQTRDCVDERSCPTEFYKPSTGQSCTVDEIAPVEEPVDEEQPVEPVLEQPTTTTPRLLDSVPWPILLVGAVILIIAIGVWMGIGKTKQVVRESARKKHVKSKRGKSEKKSTHRLERDLDKVNRKIKSQRRKLKK